MATAHHSWGAPALPVSIPTPSTKPRQRNSSRAEAAATQESILAALQKLLGQSEAPAGRSLSDLLDMYLIRLKVKSNGPDTLSKNERELRRFVHFAEQNGQLLANGIEEGLLLRYAATWEHSYPSCSTRALVRVRLLGFLRFCVKVGELKEVPDVPAIKQRREPTLPLADEQFERLLAVVGTARHRIRVSVPCEVRRAVVLLMRYSGAAVTDAIMMQRSGISFDKAKGIYRCQYRRKKTGVLINNPLPSEVAEEILEASKLCTSRTHLFHKDGLEQSRCHTRRWTDWFTKAFARAGMPGGHSHQLRDTFAVGLLLQRVPLDAVARALGHSSVKTTERYYAPWIKERQDLLDSTILAAMSGKNGGAA